MRLYYMAEAEDPRHYIRTALGVEAERWNDLHRRVLEWRLELHYSQAFPIDRELLPCDLLAEQSRSGSYGDTGPRLSADQGAETFNGGLRLIEDAARITGGIEVINVCLRKPDIKGYQRVSLDRLLNRINSSVASAKRHAFLNFDEGREEMITDLYRRLRSRNPVPSRYETWEDGERMKDIPIERVIGDPAFRSSHSDYLLQMAGLIAHALLKQEEEPPSSVDRLGLARAFCILDSVLNRRASRWDPQGVVRR